MSTHRRLEGTASWGGGLACTHVTVTIRADRPSPTHASVRFGDVIDPDLCGGLELLRRRRGAFAARVADRLGEIEIAGGNAFTGGDWQMIGRLRGAVARHAPRALAQTAFTMQLVSVTGPGLDPARADEQIRATTSERPR